MSGQQLCRKHGCRVRLGPLGGEAKIFQCGLDETLLGHVNGAIVLVVDGDAKEIINAILRGNVQAGG